MTALPTLKLRVLPTFPSSVVGAGPISVTKSSGIYTIAFSITEFGSISPVSSDYATEYLLGYDSVNSVFFKVALANLGIGGNRNQRSVIATPIVIASTDQILNCNINADAACALPAAATRNGVPLTFKDLGHAATHNITITPNGVETIDGLSSVAMTTNYQSMTLTPFNDGTNSGWFIT